MQHCITNIHCVMQAGHHDCTYTTHFVVTAVKGRCVNCTGISESQNLRISESQNLRTSESQNPRISESQNLGISESQGIKEGVFVYCLRARSEQTWGCQLYFLKRIGVATSIILGDMEMPLTLSLEMWDATSTLFRMGTSLVLFESWGMPPPHPTVRWRCHP